MFFKAGICKYWNYDTKNWEVNTFNITSKITTV